MIVKDGGEDLRLCLQSTADLVSQIVIADTGSTDDTVRIAREFNATILDVPWEGHFAKARNAALAAMRTDWVLVVDADEELSQQARDILPSLLDAGKETGGFIFPIRHYLPEERVYFRDGNSVPNLDTHWRARSAHSWSEQPSCRLFRRYPSIQYEGRVHEVVEHSIRAHHLRLEQAGCRVLHYGYLASKENHRKKALFYRDLGYAKVQEEPENAFGWFELGGIELSEFNRQAEAERCFLKAIALEPGLSAAWFLLFHLYNHQRRYDDALGVYQKMRAIGLETPAEIEDRCADYLHDRGNLDQAAAGYKRAISKAAEQCLSEPSYYAMESKLGYVDSRLGRGEEGLARMRNAVQHAPQVQDNHLRLIKGCVLNGEPGEAAMITEEALARFPAAQLYLWASALWIEAGQPARAGTILQRGKELFPDDERLLQALAAISGRGEMEPSKH